MGRRLEIDAVRGLMLVWMVMTHLPTLLPAYTNQPFGFVSASEGFIFLSALFTGRIYYRLAEHDGYPAMRQRLLLRTLRLYGYHALLLAFAFLVAVPIAAHGNRPNLYNLLDFYFAAGPKQAVIEAFLLIYRPPLLDILPMYIIFLLITPAALKFSRRVGWTPILAGSVTLWFLAHLGFRGAEHDFVNRVLGIRIPLNEMGSFDVWAWQFLWILGLWFGVRWAQGNLEVEAWAKRALIPAAMIVAILLPFRYTVGRWVELGAFEPIERDEWVPDAHAHRHFKTIGIDSGGDALTGRQLLMWNADVEISLARPTTMPACGPPRSLSPEKVTTSQCSRDSEMVGSSAIGAVAPLPRSSMSRTRRSRAT